MVCNRSLQAGQIDGQIDNQIGQINRQIDRQIARQLDSQIARQQDRQLDSSIARQPDSQIARQLDSQIARQLDSQIARQIDRQIGTQTHRQRMKSQWYQIGCHTLFFLLYASSQGSGFEHCENMDQLTGLHVIGKQIDRQIEQNGIEQNKIEQIDRIEYSRTEQNRIEQIDRQIDRQIDAQPHDCWVIFSPPLLMAKTSPSQNQTGKVKIKQSLSKSSKICQSHVFTRMFFCKKSCYINPNLADRQIDR